MPAHYWGAGWDPDGSRSRGAGAVEETITASHLAQNILLKFRGRGGAAHPRQQLSHLLVPVVSQASTVPDRRVVKT